MLKLDAINQMLSGIGQTPVSTIEDNQHPDVLSALAVLNRIDKKVQSKGWWFNTDYALTLSYNPITLEVVLPSNTLGIEPSGTDLTYVQRGNRLYNYTETTFEIGTNVDVDIKVQITFEDVPESAAAYIAATAVYEFVRDKVGDNVKMQELKNDILATKIEVNKDNINYSNINVYNNPNVQIVMGGIRPAY